MKAELAEAKAKALLDLEVGSCLSTNRDRSCAHRPHVCLFMVGGYMSGFGLEVSKYTWLCS